ncbi:GNAT family N-acetyltransferase [Melioribacteraceae bacterium 4301-Me]|uniref:GNAT family N-acetyltransferase n=1 Tax=Pyranulibacter aquaticus TaxID=3163344 RepID=UPI003596CEF6
MENLTNKLSRIISALLAGEKAATEETANELPKLLDECLLNVVELNLLHEKEILDKLSQIFSYLFASNLHKIIVSRIDKEIYFLFGKSLVNEVAYSDQFKNIIYDYLDLFRLPEFLTKIYGDKRWEKLILDLIIVSNFDIASLVSQRLKNYYNKTLFKVFDNGTIKEYKWREVKSIIDIYSKSLLSLITKQQNKFVAFLMENSLETALLDIACLSSKIVNVMIPANSVSNHILFILNQTKASVLFVYDEKELIKIRSIRKELKHLKIVVLVKGNVTDEWVIPFNKFIEMANQHSEEEFNHFKLAFGSSDFVNDVATIMYTSGTTGDPKGIMFSQLNIIYKRFCRAMAIPQIGENDRFLAYLPLYHTFGRYFELFGSLFWGAEYCFMENPSVETMTENMQLFKPTIFISIPKKWMQLYEFISTKVNIEIDEHDKIKSTIENITGGNLKWGLSAAGYLPPEIFLFFQRYGIELMSGFGMTEATGGITMTPPGKYIENSLGCALPGIEIKVNPDGELLIRGPYVMLGYFDEEKKKTFDAEGWFHTGDIMEMDSNGYVEIVDRKKEIYKNIKGETIAPQKIENLFRDFEFINQVFLVGDHRPFNTILINPKKEFEETVLAEMTFQQKQEYFASTVVSVNKFLSPFERIIDFRLIDRPFSAEYGELTPKGTYKRRVIEENFKSIIEQMYVKPHTQIEVNGLEVWVPNWFLREKGTLSRDVVADNSFLLIPKLNLSLRIEKKDNNQITIGSFNYTVNMEHVDIQSILTNPYLWLGNFELYRFAGESIFEWVRQVHHDKNIKFHSVSNELIDCSPFIDVFKKIFEQREYSLRGLNLASLIIQTDCQEAKLALVYISNLLQDSSQSIYKIALDLIQRPHLGKSIEIRREMFLTALTAKDNLNTFNLFNTFLNFDYDLLNDYVIEKIIKLKRDINIITVTENLIDKYTAEVSKNLTNTFIPSLFKLLKVYGSYHPASYQRIRQVFVKYITIAKQAQNREDLSELSKLVSINLNELQNNFREWLGPNQTIAVDSESGYEYTWGDVITFDENVDFGDKEIITEAIIDTPLLREAIFIFSHGKLIRLDDIFPRGIWISHLRSYHDKSVYRISVQTRFYGGFELVLNINKKLPKENILEEVNWLILAGSRHFLHEFTEDFGGYWENYDMWTGKYVPGDTVKKFIQKEFRKSESSASQKDESTEAKLSLLWQFFIWNAAAAYCNFWRLTGYKLQLTDPSPNNFIIPPHDYQTGTKVVSFSERGEFSSLVDFLISFYNGFVIEIEKEFPSLKSKSAWDYIFSGMLNAEGERSGLKLLHMLKEEISKSELNTQLKELSDKLTEFIEQVENYGYMPKQLFFAIKRFKRWFALNKDADLSAQATMLYDLYETYFLPDLEKNFPETRIRFFLETVFSDSNNSLRNALFNIMKQQKFHLITKDEATIRLTNLHSEFNLTEKENFFLTRLTYPFLKPTDSAAIIKIKAEGPESSNLVVQLVDYDGNVFLIRKPISPKEISRLHQLFIEANLIVNFRPEHQFLVALSERGFIIGGLFYLPIDENTVHMEKIVVSNMYRRKGISEGLMNELSKRLKNDGYKSLTTGYFRPEYFYRFGFKIEKKFSGLVKDLTEI